jgi:hypothetical protein
MDDLLPFRNCRLVLLSSRLSAIRLLVLLVNNPSLTPRSNEESYLRYPLGSVASLEACEVH